MTTKDINSNAFRPAKKRLDISSGESLRIMRELNELSQLQLADLSGIQLSVLQEIECDRLEADSTQIATLARVLHCPPSALIN
ncbi:helix-turn-helix domain-containing protein [Duganella sp. FT80W]|uniref:Helix-turn-helix domain-containing protein n=1 Tax=Duganella guangzhouensis TaxID=2666084 RepID=A0A6I2L4K2_9BURK|nr:helix-turn-helix transcriptional regulator [Duganella guangzhouensis]MRW93078.1 helix-turn-helix domain-containing protein [Duganella guangzhouensis]